MGNQSQAGDTGSQHGGFAGQLLLQYPDLVHFKFTRRFLQVTPFVDGLNMEDRGERKTKVSESKRHFGGQSLLQRNNLMDFTCYCPQEGQQLLELQVDASKSQDDGASKVSQAKDCNINILCRGSYPSLLLARTCIHTHTWLLRDHGGICI